MYTTYEKRMINTLIKLYPDLEEKLQAIVDRLVDLKVIVHDHYYHPSMLGSWSIKEVLPTITPHLSYEKLEGIRDGALAADGYLEAIDPDTSPERKAELEEQLLRYCRFDTEAMVEITSFLTRH
jgi:predicted RecB family nuclease